jgi:hypothetical protein
MSQHNIKNEAYTQELGNSAMGIPIEFAMDLPLCLPIKIQPFHSMSQSNIPSQKNLIPALFQIAARAEDVQWAPSLRSTVAAGHTSLAEAMLDPQRLEGILNAVSRRKKPASRRASDKKNSADNGELD